MHEYWSCNPQDISNERVCHVRDLIDQSNSFFSFSLTKNTSKELRTKGPWQWPIKLKYCLRSETWRARAIGNKRMSYTYRRGINKKRNEMLYDEDSFGLEIRKKPRRHSAVCALKVLENLAPPFYKIHRKQFWIAADWKVRLSVTNTAEEGYSKISVLFMFILVWSFISKCSSSFSGWKQHSFLFPLNRNYIKCCALFCPVFCLPYENKRNTLSLMIQNLSFPSQRWIWSDHRNAPRIFSLIFTQQMAYGI